MKKLIILIMVAIIAMDNFLKAQTAFEVINKDIPITFFGLDYSKAKGVMLNATSSEVVTKYIPAINKLMIDESEKFSIGKHLNKTKFNYDLTDVTRLNALIDTNNFQLYEPKKVEPISDETINTMIKQYTLTGRTGTGLVLIVQTIDKTTKKATYNMVFFKLPEGQIILNEIIVGNAGGFGFRNYWGNTVYDILKYDLKRIKNKYSK
jgi:uncharacterized integral membrane protein